MACDTCHEFGPNDDILTGGTSGNPDAAAINTAYGFTPTDPLQYFYSSRGDHIAHGMADTGTPANPAAADAAGLCDKCHRDEGTPTDGTAYANDHTNGAVDMRTVINSINGDNGTWTGTTCTTVDCHGNTTTPVWGSGNSVPCGDCHGLPIGTDDRSAYADPTDAVQGAPPNDLAGGTNISRVGKHLSHVNVSYGFTGDNSCTLCHDGAGTGSSRLLSAQLRSHAGTHVWQNDEQSIVVPARTREPAVGESAGRE